MESIICLDHLNKEYSSEFSSKYSVKKTTVAAVKDVSMEIGRGEIYGIIGFSGAGKSTLVRCMNLLERPSSGRVLIDGVDLTGLSPGELRKKRKKIGMIFQHFNLMPSRTVFENVAYPLKGGGLKNRKSSAEIQEKVRELLRLVGMEEKENAYPSQLSGGQKQRTAIARALANDPDILLCDEATSALDPQTTRSILLLLKQLNETLGITIVLITHEMAVVKEICSRVAVMEAGRIVEQGATFEIFANPQNRLTKQFTAMTSNLKKVEELIEKDSSLVNLKKGERIVRMSFVERGVSEPLISEISRRFDIVLNIIFADVEMVQGYPLGGTVAIIGGSRAQIDQAMEYLKERNVKVEVLKDADDT